MRASWRAPPAAPYRESCSPKTKPPISKRLIFEGAAMRECLQRIGGEHDPTRALVRGSRAARISGYAPRCAASMQERLRRVTSKSCMPVCHCRPTIAPLVGCSRASELNNVTGSPS